MSLQLLSKIRHELHGIVYDFYAGSNGRTTFAVDFENGIKAIVNKVLTNGINQITVRVYHNLKPINGIWTEPLENDQDIFKCLKLLTNK